MQFVKNICITLLVFCLLLVTQGALSAQQNAVVFDFHDNVIVVDFNQNAEAAPLLRFSEDGFRSFYADLDRSELQYSVTTLIQYKQDLQLNDWVYLRLLERFLDAAYPTKNRMYRRAALWYLLNKSNYDARLTWLGQQVFVTVYSQDEVFETPKFMLDRGTFINITAVGNPDVPQDVYLLEFAPSPQGRSFSFSMPNLPLLSVDPLIRVFEFDYANKPYIIEVNIDNTLVNIWDDYPGIDESQYILTPLSPLSKASLLPQLREAMTGMTQRQKIEFLVTFTRQGLSYKEDDDYFGRNKPMIAEEALHYRYSDCEDRCALFYQLLRELLDLPAIILAYPDHLTVGVQLDQNIGKTIRHRGRNYTLCDPTGPENISDIGIYPNDAARQRYKILLSSHD